MDIGWNTRIRSPSWSFAERSSAAALAERSAICPKVRVRVPAPAASMIAGSPGRSAA